jgi:uncharacterized protein YndB with AHSA1/START domain
MSHRTQGTPRVVVERTYRASLEDVWDLWTTKEGFASWWGPQGFRADVHALEARPGGALHYDMVAETPEMIAEMAKIGRPPSHPVHATFAELRPRERLVIRSVIDFLPGVEPYDSDIDVDLAVIGDRVRMKVTIGGMHSDEFNRMQEQGLTSQLTKLDARFASG